MNFPKTLRIFMSIALSLIHATAASPFFRVLLSIDDFKRLKIKNEIESPFKWTFPRQVFVRLPDMNRQQRIVNALPFHPHAVVFRSALPASMGTTMPKANVSTKDMRLLAPAFHSGKNDEWSQKSRSMLVFKGWVK